MALSVLEFPNYLTKSLRKRFDFFKTIQLKFEIGSDFDPSPAAADAASAEENEIKIVKNLGKNPGKKPRKF